jgi:hypothetical protein
VQITVGNAGNSFTCSGVTFTEGQAIRTVGSSIAVVRFISGCPLVYWEGGSAGVRTNYNWLALLSGKTISDAILTSCLKWDGQSCSLRVGAEEKEAGQGEVTELVVVPNPNDGTFEVSFYLQKGGKATLSVIGLKGESWFEKAIKGTGKQKEKIILPGAVSGTCIILLRREDGVEVEKTVVVR